MFKKYDIIIVGGGHAGCEAAYSSSKMKAKVLLITNNLQNIGAMSCNPAIGGIAKGQIVKEIDSLGGMTGFVTDNSMIHFRMLNKSKGPAMWSPRAQCDRSLFSRIWKYVLEKNHLDLYQDTVVKLLIDNEKVIGVETILGIRIRSRIVILTNGTFLNGSIYMGKKKFYGGRLSENSVSGLTEQLSELGFSWGRMKTGTSPRIDGRSLDYSIMLKQKSDKYPKNFSFLTKNIKLDKKINCYITQTSLEVHNLLKLGFNDSPMFNGVITSSGPRYCPSIEEKIHRFPNKDSHQIFIEPEGVNTNEIYVNGFSTSLPIQVQYKALKKVKGFKNVKILKFGYAVEYDFFHPTQLKSNLETKLLKNLFLAGQINGTTGYEEAASQGLVAGINAVLKIKSLEPFILKRNESYIGVLINDLTTKGTNEPYRMFTSRAEYRMLLRQDNADERLTELGYSIGLIDKERMSKIKQKIKNVNNCINYFNKEKLTTKEISFIKKNNISVFHKNTISYLLTRPEYSLKYILKNISRICNNPIVKDLTNEELESVYINIKYKGYIDKEKENLTRLSKLDNFILPNNFNYNKLCSLSNEAIEKLNQFQPKTIKEAYEISGISLSDINTLFFFLKKHKQLYVRNN